MRALVCSMTVVFSSFYRVAIDRVILWLLRLPGQTMTLRRLWKTRKRVPPTEAWLFGAWWPSLLLCSTELLDFASLENVHCRPKSCSHTNFENVLGCRSADDDSTWNLLRKTKIFGAPTIIGLFEKHFKKNERTSFYKTCTRQERE